MPATGGFMDMLLLQQLHFLAKTFFATATHLSKSIDCRAQDNVAYSFYYTASCYPTICLYGVPQETKFTIQMPSAALILLPAAKLLKLINPTRYMQKTIKRTSCTTA